jgi:hypothetical protein
MPSENRGSILLLGAVVALGGGALAFVACGDDHAEHNFANFAECFEHETEEGASAELATSECDEHFEITHADQADCISDHAADVTAGVPQSAIDEHCSRLFPGADGGTGDGG